MHFRGTIGNALKLRVLRHPLEPKNLMDYVMDAIKLERNRVLDLTGKQARRLLNRAERDRRLADMYRGSTEHTKRKK